MTVPLLTFVLPILLFVPGYFALDMLQRHLKWPKLSFGDRLLAGALLWTFILVGTSTFVGIISTSVMAVFDYFLVISALLLTLGIVDAIRSKFHVAGLGTLETIFIPGSIILLTYFLVAYFQTPYVEYDANKIYLPFSLAIAKTGGLQYDPYRLTQLTDTGLPAGPLIFAWLLRYSSLPALAVAGVFFVAYTALIVFKETVLLCSKEIAMVATAVFLIFPATLIMASIRYMYLDILFVFFLLGLIYTLTRAFKRREFFWLILTFVSLALMLLSREFGFFLIPSIVAILIAKYHGAVYRVSSLILFGLAFTFFSFWDVLNFPGTDLSTIILRWIPVALVTAVFWILTAGNTVMASGKPRLGKYSFLPIILSVPAAFISRNMIALGAVTANWTPFSSFQKDPQYEWVLAHTMSTFYQHAPTDLFGYLRYDQLLFATGSAGFFFTPFLLGVSLCIGRVIRKKEFALEVFLGVFLALLLLFSYLFPLDFDIRRFYLLSPFAALLVAVGLVKLPSMLGLSPEQCSILALLTVFASFAVTWSFVLSNETISGLIVESIVATKVELWPLAASFLIPIGIAAAFRFANLWKTSSFLLPLMKRRNLRGITVVIISVLLVSSATSPLILDAFLNGSQTQTYVWSGWEGGLMDVISFYKTNITDSFTTVGFYAHELIYYANRTLIDLTSIAGISTFLPVLDAGTNAVVLGNLIGLGIRYFLLPLPSHPLYYLFAPYASRFRVFQMIETSPDFVLVKTFDMFRLIRFVPPP